MNRYFPMGISDQQVSFVLHKIPQMGLAKRPGPDVRVVKSIRSVLLD